MVFFKTNHQNLRSCALSVILLNYDCGITSYVLMIRNRVETVGVEAYAWATSSLLFGLVIGQIIFGIFGDTVGRRYSFYGSVLFMLIGSVLSVFPGLFDEDLIWEDQTMIEFGLFRFILGVGAGGMNFFLVD